MLLSINLSSLNLEKKVEAKFNYIYVAELSGYCRMGDQAAPGRCIPKIGRFCSYMSEVDLGIIVTEQQLKNVHAIPGHHQGSYQLQ